MECFFISRHLQEDISYTQPSILLSHTPTADVSDSQITAVRPARQRKAQSTSFWFSELHLNNTALKERQIKEDIYDKKNVIQCD